MVKRPTGSGGEPSSPNCGASAGGKARQLPLFLCDLPRAAADSACTGDAVDSPSAPGDPVDGGCCGLRGGSALGLHSRELLSARAAGPADGPFRCPCLRARSHAAQVLGTRRPLRASRAGPGPAADERGSARACTSATSTACTTDGPTIGGRAWAPACCPFTSAAPGARSRATRGTNRAGTAAPRAASKSTVIPLCRHHYGRVATTAFVTHRTRRHLSSSIRAGAGFSLT